jgi:phosphopantetheinyl transferase (holo-ACP synthase)
LDRICTFEEAEAVRRSVNPVRALAAFWASKEAAYKLFSKQLARCRFVPRQYVSQIENRDPAHIDEKLSILYADVQTEVSIFAGERWVHAVAASPAMRVHWKVREIEKCFVGNRKTSSESEAVRSLANDLLDELGLQDMRLLFDGRVPKLKHKGMNQSGFDVSLSHHGAFAAAAIAWPASYRRPLMSDDLDFAQTMLSEAVCSTCTV